MHQQVIAPYLQAHCLACHQGPMSKSGVDLSLLTGDVRIQTELWQSVRRQIESGEMPPPKEPRPPAKQSSAVIGWIERELGLAGKTATKPQPQFGNEMPHEPLFDPANAKLPAATPARYWRLSPYIYAQAMQKQHNSGNKLVSPFNLLPGNGFKDYALPLAIDEPVAALLWLNAEAIVFARFPLDPQTGKLAKPRYREIGEAFDEQVPLTDAKLTKIINEEFRIVLGRAPEAHELSQWLAQLKKNIDAGGRAVGLKMTLAMLYLHPEFVYRKEVGEGPADPHGRRMLSPRELTFAIAYALGDKWPDATLLKAAAEGQLATRDDVAREVNRLLDDPKFEKTRILRFFQEYFGYRSAVNVFKTDFTHGLHLPADNVADTDALILDIVNKDQNVLAELLTCGDVFLITERGGDKRHKPFYAYNFPEAPPEVKGQKRTRVAAPAGQRSGILTQPSWLVAQSTNFDNHAIARGHWIRERLLGGTIPEIPLNVDAKLPEDPDKTLRERMHVTRAEYCWKCHQKMDPLGLPFEMYDHFGRYRETETVLDPAAPPPAKNKKPATRELPVDARGEISGTGDPTLDGPVQNATELLQKLARSPRVEQVFIRHAFRYWLGRNEMLSDASTLQNAQQAYRAGGGSFRALLVSLLTSDSFLYRTGDVPTTPLLSP